MFNLQTASQSLTQIQIQAPVKESVPSLPSAPEVATQVSAGFSGEEHLLKITLALMAVLLLILVIAWFFKRQTGLKRMIGLPIKTIAVAPMGMKEKIILIEIGGKQLLLGMTPHSIHTLAEFDEPIIEVKDPSQNAFANKLKDIMRQAMSQTKNE